MKWKPASGLIGLHENLATVDHPELGEIAIHKSLHDHSIHIFKAGQSGERHVVTLRDIFDDYLENAVRLKE